MTIYKAICAWCSKLIRDGELDAYGRCTHGICPECAEKLLQEVKDEN